MSLARQAMQATETEKPNGAQRASLPALTPGDRSGVPAPTISLIHYGERATPMLGRHYRRRARPRRAEMQAEVNRLAGDQVERLSLPRSK